MELNREYFRTIIFCNSRDGLTQQSMDEPNKIFEDEAPSRICVNRWYGKFNRSHGFFFVLVRKQLKHFSRPEEVVAAVRDASIRITKVLRQRIQMCIDRSSWGIFRKIIK